MRLIDADEIRIKPEYMHDICGSVMIGVEDVARILNEMPTINSQPHWTPCSERPPEEETDVFVCNANGDIEISRGSLYSTEVKDYFIWHTTRWRFGEPIAWMSLPKPYQEEGDSN